MIIAFYDWKNTDTSTRQRVMRRSQADISSVEALVYPILEDVRLNGDKALKNYALKFDGANIDSLKANEFEFVEAEKRLDNSIKSAIKRCADNVRKFHQEQMKRVEKSWMIEIEPGVWAGEQVSAIESVGLYVPRGKGAFPSALYMLAIPAVIAGVPHISIVSPPTSLGTTDDATLFTAKLCGVKNVYKCGGAQAIAALAFGTESIHKVRKVLGPGSLYVAAAKRLLSDKIDPGMPAGPSESIILADETAHYQNTLYDILNEAEHGMDSAVLLVTHHRELAEYVRENLPRVINTLPHPHREICKHVMCNYGGVILTDSFESSIAFSNDYAPEHLHLKIKNAKENLHKFLHAGEILIGEYTPSSLGNYGIGVNHVLPTGAWAHTYSCTSVWDFLKRTSLSHCDKNGFLSLKDDVVTLTDYEGFPAHRAALEKREL